MSDESTNGCAGARGSVLAVRTQTTILTPQMAAVQAWINDQVAGRLHVDTGLVRTLIHRLEGRIPTAPDCEKPPDDRPLPSRYVYQRSETR